MENSRRRGLKCFERENKKEYNREGLQGEKMSVKETETTREEERKVRQRGKQKDRPVER